MAAQKVRLYIRPRLPQGKRPFLEPVYSANHKLKAGYGLAAGGEQRFTCFVYYLRYVRGGKRTWVPVGSDASRALTELIKLDRTLQAQAVGVAVVTADSNAQGNESTMDSSLKLADSVAEFLAEVQNGRAKSTYFAYRVCLTEFRDGSQRRTLAGLDRKDVLAFISALRQRGMSERTIAHRLQLLKTFFLHYKVMWPLLKIDRIRYTEKTVEAYNSEELQRLFAAANQNEIDLFQFLLCTGVREQEAMYATWRDVDFFRKTFKVTEKRDLGFTPKDKEEGVIPIPDSLVVLLQARRKRYPHSRLIFGLANGEADFHFLRTLQNLAFRAGMNCGECYTKSGKKCCATAAMCKHWGLHKFRKTFATLHHEAGVPVRTIQRWLRHSSLETTLRYLAGGDDRSEKTRAQVNSTFAGLQRSDPPVAPIIGPSPGRKVLLM